MTKIISVNAGSSSLKFQMYNMPQEEVVTSGVVECIGLEKGIFTIKVGDEKIRIEKPIPNHEVAVEMLLAALVEYKIVNSFDEIQGVGHRVVHGGEYFDSSVIVSNDVVEKVARLSELAPLHNPANLTGYYSFKKALNNAEHTFVFDTAFHQTMPPEAFLYPLPYEYYTDYKVRKYGFHGTSHDYVSKELAKAMKKDIKDVNSIICHLGNGASLSAVKCGKCIDTSMGFTPLAGVMMGTRSGDIDPAIVTYLCNKLNVSNDEFNSILNKKSGMLGVSGISSDAREINSAVEEGIERAIITRKLYADRITSYIGKYAMKLGRVDAIAFTAGIGENDTGVRLDVINDVKEALGIDFNVEKNNCSRGEVTLLSNPDSKVQVWLLPTNEELVIARDTAKLLGIK